MTVNLNTGAVVPSEAATVLALPKGAGHGRRVAGLDGVRGLAALMILVYHFMPMTSPDRVTSWLIYLSGVLWIGVDLFFVLSGYLITGILYDAKDAPHYFRNFYARRALRIFPLYYGTLTAIFVVLPLMVWALGLEHSLEARLGVYYAEFKYVRSRQAVLWLYLSNVPGLVDPRRWLYFMGHFWSLAVEEHFYLAWPAVVLLLDRRRLLTVCLFCIMTSLVVRTATAFTSYDNRLFCCIFTPLRLEGLAIGALLAVLARDEGGIARLARSARWVGAATLLALVAGFRTQDSLHVNTTFATTVGFTLTAALCGAFLVLVLTASPTSIFSRVMGGSFLRFFGKYSYALYVYNRFLMLPCKRLFPSERLGHWLGSPPLGALAHIALGTALTSVFAVLSWHLFEKQFLKLKVYFEGGPEPRGGGPPRVPHDGPT